MVAIGTEIRLVKQRFQNGQSGLRVMFALRIVDSMKVPPETNQPLAPIAAADESTGSQSLNGSAGRLR